MGNRSIQDMPGFFKGRFAAYSEERVAKEWRGNNLFRSGRPSEHDLNLMSNDYLALARHPEIIAAQCASLKQHGLGVMMSPIFVQDEGDEVLRIERQIAGLLGFAEGIITQSGYSANQGLLEAVAAKDTAIYIDSRAHASLYMGVLSSRARRLVFHHNDMDNLRDCIEQGGPGIIAVDSLYSAMGDFAPLERLVEIARSSGCLLIVDESHALGVYGDQGEGLVAKKKLSDDVDFITASLAKAYCSRAGFVAAPAGFRAYFGIHSMPAVFSSMLLPHDFAGIEAAHAVVIHAIERRQRLRSSVSLLRKGLSELGYPVDPKGSAIIPLVVGTDYEAAMVRDALAEEGIFGALFTPPATPRGASLVRLSMHAGLSKLDIERIVHAMGKLRSRCKPETWIRLENDMPVSVR